MIGYGGTSNYRLAFVNAGASSIAILASAGMMQKRETPLSERTAAFFLLPMALGGHVGSPLFWATTWGRPYHGHSLFAMQFVRYRLRLCI